MSEETSVSLSLVEHSALRAFHRNLRTNNTVLTKKEKKRDHSTGKLK